MSLFAVHYHELGLKGGNRRRFERVLVGNCEKSLRRLGRRFSIRSVEKRLLVSIEADDTDADRPIVAAAFDLLTRICGVAHVMRTLELPRDVDAVAAAIIAEFSRREQPVASFRISSRRSDKLFPMLSTEVNREVGGRVVAALGIPVRLKGAAEDVRISVLRACMLVSLERRRGPGGLPAGTAGRVAVLMSGGYDSPVAAWQMINRGCKADLIHFHSHPLVDKTTQEKARDLAEVLTEWQYATKLFLVPLAPIQTQVRLHCPEPLRVILYRRFMVRIAERLARGRNCDALVTGESVGQVASQTLENLATVDHVVDMLVLRPLIGTDKQDIIARAKRIRTAAISERRDQDCCQLFIPAKPATASTPQQAALAEEPLDVDALVSQAVEDTEVISFP